MKLRLVADSIRIRLNRGDVETLRNTGGIAEGVRCGPLAEQTLRYAVLVSHTAAALTAECTAGNLIVHVPESQAATWLASDETTLCAEQDTGEGKILSLKLEKDFACLKPRGAEDADAFPHPTPHLSC